MRFKDLQYYKVEEAKRFLKEPLEVGFKMWMPMKDRDQVTMQFEQLAQLMAWYRELGLQQNRTQPEEGKLDAPKPKQLPGDTNG